MYADFQLQAQQYGTDNLVDFSKGLLKLGDIVGDVSADGKVNFEDADQVLRLGGLVAQLKKAPEAIKEAKELSVQEYEEAKAAVQAFAKELKADSEPDVIEAKAEAAIVFAIQTARFLNAITEKAA